MKNSSPSVALVVAVSLTAILGTQAAGKPLPRSAPEARGISSQAICAAERTKLGQLVANLVGHPAKPVKR